MTPLEWALLPESARAILRIFNGFKSRGQDIFPKQATIAGMIGCTREQVNRSIGVLEKRGFIKKAKRHSRFIVYLMLIVSLTPRNPRQITSRGPTPYYLTGRLKSTGYTPFKPTGRTDKPLEYTADPDLEAFIAAHQARQDAAACASATQSPDRKPAMRQEASNHKLEAIL